MTKDAVRVERVGDEMEQAIGEAEIEEVRARLGRELDGKFILATHGNPQHPRYFVGDRFGELYDRNWSLNAGCARGWDSGEDAARVLATFQHNAEHLRVERYGGAAAEAADEDRYAGYRNQRLAELEGKFVITRRSTTRPEERLYYQDERFVKDARWK